MSTEFSERDVKVLIDIIAELQRDKATEQLACEYYRKKIDEENREK